MQSLLPLYHICSQNSFMSIHLWNRYVYCFVGNINWGLREVEHLGQDHIVPIFIATESVPWSFTFLSYSGSSVYQKWGQIHDHTPEDFFSSPQREAYSSKYSYRNYSDLNNCCSSLISPTSPKHRTCSSVRSCTFVWLRAFAQAALTAWNLRTSSHLLLANWCPDYFSLISPCPGRLPRPLLLQPA